MTNPTERPTVFLDIDDVLALNERYGGFDVQRAMAVPDDAADDLYRSLFSPAAVQALNTLLREFSPRLVLTTSWLALLERRQFISLFARTGVDISDATLHPHWDAQQDRGVSRLQAIERWMGRHHRGEPVLVIDDYSSGESLVGSAWQKSGRVVLCSVNVGFNDDLMDAARWALRKCLPTRMVSSFACDAGGKSSVDEEFEPNERQRRLVAEAAAQVEAGRGKGHFAPVELVRRMQSEGESVTSSPPGPATSAGGQPLLQPPAPGDQEPRASRTE